LDLTKEHERKRAPGTLRLLVGVGIIAIGSMAAFLSFTSSIARVADADVVHSEVMFLGDDLPELAEDCICAQGQVCHMIEGENYGSCKIDSSVNGGACIGFDYEYATFNTDDQDWYANCDITQGRYDCFSFPCQNKGFCIDAVDSYECECSYGWTDTNCDKNINECADNSNVCDEYAQCTDMVPDYRCACLEGFEGDGYNKQQETIKYGSILKSGPLGARGWIDRSEPDYSRAGCEDIDDCANEPCENGGVCIDLWRNPDPVVGPQSQKFRCDCSASLPAEHWFGDLCERNFDECAQHQDNCHPHATCVDTPGSFTCTCNQYWEGDGFDIESSPVDFSCEPNVSIEGRCPAGESYSGCSDVNDCDIVYTEGDAVTVQSVCMNDGSCSETKLIGTGLFECTCTAGWEGDVCEVDVDECIAKPHDDCAEHAKCINTPGSWECACNLGWTGDGHDVCTDADDCEFGPCENGGTCTDAGLGIFEAYLCDCIEGWDGRRCDDDWNECVMGIHSCHDMAMCLNTAGSYDCECEPGYSGDGFQMCNEVDDCFVWEDDESFDDALTVDYAHKTYNPSTGELNTEVGQISPAPWSDDYRKIDKDGVVVHQCGVWNAATDEFASHGKCSHIGDAAFLCRCDPGWTDKKCDHNINECQLSTHDCHRYATCTDTEGSYECLFNRGFGGDVDGVIDCHDIDDCVHSEDVCMYGKCVDLGVEDKRCTCSPGWEDKLCDLDINECGTQTDECSENANCINTDGSYSCECKSGWQGVAVGLNGCEDIDDCGSSPCERGECIDTGANSYKCVCELGWTDTKCDFDVNECATRDSYDCHAEGKCVNTPGSYYCRCVSGFAGDGKTCVDLDDCDPDPCGKHNNDDGSYYGGDCHDTGANSFSCGPCPGYDKFCDNDVDECSERDPSDPERTNNDCHLQALCTNLEGKHGFYSCECDTGYYGDGFDPQRRAGSKGCTKCSSCDEGYELDLRADRCAIEDTTCININECGENSHDCHVKADCYDTEGSYVCECDIMADGNQNQWTSIGGLGRVRDGGCHKCHKCEAGEKMVHQCSATDQRVCAPILEDGVYAIGTAAGSTQQCLVKWKEDQKIYPERYHWGGRAHTQSESGSNTAPDYCESPICGVCNWDGKSVEENILEGLEAAWTFRRISEANYLIYNRAGSKEYRCLGFQEPDATYPGMLVYVESRIPSTNVNGSATTIGSFSSEAVGHEHVDFCDSTGSCEPWYCGYEQTPQGRTEMLANGGVVWNVHALGCEKETGFCESRKYDSQFLLRSLARGDNNYDGFVDAMDYECIYFPNVFPEATTPRRVPMSTSTDGQWMGSSQSADTDGDGDLECGINADFGVEQEEALVTNKQATYSLTLLRLATETKAIAVAAKPVRPEGRF